MGAGRCCVVYSGVSVFDGSPVALKFFKRGSEYDSALRRERYVLERLSAPHHNLVECAAQITYRGAHCLVMELLDLNIRQVRMFKPAHAHEREHVYPKFLMIKSKWIFVS